MIGLEKRPWYRQKGDVGCKEPGKIKRREKGNTSARIGPIRIVDFIFIMPPSFPMVSLVRNYVRVVHMPQFGRGWDGGRISNRAPDELDYHTVG